MKSEESINIKTTGCIPQHTLRAYLKGKLSGVEMNAVERHLSGCPMCFDELEGLEMLGEPNEITAISNSINRKIDELIKHHKKSFWTSTSFRVAASITMLVAVSSLIYYTANLDTSKDILSENFEFEESISLEEIILADKLEEEASAETDDSNTKRQTTISAEKIPPPATKISALSIVNDDIDVKDDAIAASPKARLSSGASVAKKQSATESSGKKEIVIILNESIAFDLADEKLVVPIMSFSDNEKEMAEDEIFVIVEQMPKFGNGNSNEFNEYITKNIRYPESALENGIQGRVFVAFVVEKDGSVSNVKIVRGVDPSLDEEAIRVIKSSPKWKPGMQRGQPSRVTFTVPVVFRLE
jgi:TonB family protein